MANWSGSKGGSGKGAEDGDMTAERLLLLTLLLFALLLLLLFVFIVLG